MHSESQQTPSDQNNSTHAREKIQNSWLFECYLLVRSSLKRSFCPRDVGVTQTLLNYEKWALKKRFFIMVCVGGGTDGALIFARRGVEGFPFFCFQCTNIPSRAKVGVFEQIEKPRLPARVFLRTIVESQVIMSMQPRIANGPKGSHAMLH